jgi:hypothetical protein
MSDRGNQGLVEMVQALVDEHDSLVEHHREHHKLDLGHMHVGAEFELADAEEFHPRAMKLIRKRKNFLAVADDEPYFMAVYYMLRGVEQQFGRWTDDDEAKFQAAREKWEAEHD